MAYEKKIKTFSIGDSGYETDAPIILAGINFEWGKGTPTDIMEVLKTGPAIARLMQGVMDGLKSAGYNCKETKPVDEISMSVDVELPKGKPAYIQFEKDFERLIKTQVATDPELKALITPKARQHGA